MAPMIDGQAGNQKEGRNIELLVEAQEDDINNPPPPHEEITPTASSVGELKGTSSQAGCGVHLLAGIAVYILGSVAFIMGAYAGTSQEVAYKIGMGTWLPLWIFVTGGALCGLPAVTVHLVLVALLNWGARNQLSPHRRIFASAVFTVIVFFIAGHLFIACYLLWSQSAAICCRCVVEEDHHTALTRQGVKY